MARFIAWLWDPKDASACAVSLRWQRELQRFSWLVTADLAGFAFALPGDRTRSSHLLTGGQGALVGTLFRSRDYSPLAPSEIESLSVDRILKTGGAVLAREFWGRYTCVLVDRVRHELVAYRDPSGGIPCFHISHRGTHLLCSRPSDLALLGVPAFDVHDDYLATQLARQANACRTTALHGVTELQPGDALRVGTSRIEFTAYWSANAFAKESLERPDAESDGALASQLRTTVTRCVESWAGAHPRMVHTLSGGIDSSIVAAALTATSIAREVVCLNYVSPDAEGNEERYAAAVADQCGFERVTHVRQAEAVSYERLRELIPAASPSRHRYSLEHGRTEATLAHRRGATSVWDGGGGDELFFQAPVMLAASDALRVLGPRDRFWQFAAAVVHEQGRSWADMLARTVLGAWDPTDRHARVASSPYLQLLTEDVRARRAQREYHAPAIEAARGLPPGKRLQITALSVAHPYFDAVGETNDPQHVSPLLSQPLIELCLRIPTWRLCHAGLGRGLARLAFADALPPIVIERRGKGRPSAHIERTVRANAEFVRAFLSHGAMVCAGFLDPDRLQRALSMDSSVPNETYTELEDHLSTEAWLRSIAALRERSRARAIRLSI